jgi:hypothetical protein
MCREAFRCIPPPGLPLNLGGGVDEGDGGVKIKCLVKNKLFLKFRS